MRQPGSVAAGTPDGMGGFTATIGAATATCPAGSFAVGGGVGIGDTSNTSVADSFPEPGGRGWTVRVDNSSPAAQAFTVVAVCLAAGAAG